MIKYFLRIPFVQITKNFMEESMRSMSGFSKVIAGVTFLALFVIVAGLAPFNTVTDSPDDLKALIKKVVDAFNNRDLKTLEECYASKFIHHSNSEKGTERTAKDFLDGNIEDTLDYKFTATDIIVEGDKVVNRYIYEGTDKKSGKKIRMVGICISRVKNGKIVEEWEIVDKLTYIKQLGYVITPPKK